MIRDSSGIDVERTFAVDADKYCAIKLGAPHSNARTVARLFLRDLDFRVVACFRFRQWAGDLWSRDRARGLVPMVVASIWRRRTSVIHHADIDRGARIGPGLLVMHRSGLSIGPVEIGDNCVMHHNTTIGERVALGDNTVPRIGSDVWIGPNVTITGGVTIGDGATISAGSVVSRDIPAGALVAGNPGRVIQADYDNAVMLNYRVIREPASPDNVHAIRVQAGA